LHDDGRAGDGGRAVRGRGGRDARRLDAGAEAVADDAAVLVAGRDHGERLGRGRAVAAHVPRALVVVDGDVGVVDAVHDVAGAVALVLVAVVRRLAARRGAGHRVVHAAGVARAGAGLALGVAARALRRRVALHALAGRGAHRAAVLVAGRVDRLRR